jgi:hypothetical protein
MVYSDVQLTKIKFCGVLAALIIVLQCNAAHSEIVTVQVRESVIRNRPLFYAPGVANVRYGDRLDRLSEESKGWTRVRHGSVEGYVPQASVSLDTIVLSAKQIKTVQADSSEVVLAGKGFSREVEQEYRKRSRTARFDLVDRVENAARVSRQDVADFASKGRLH